ncbi:family 20 glycosylhydrolase [Sphingomonas panni]
MALLPSPRSMTFIKNVLDELIDIFPGQFIHVGGDEAVKDQWQRSPEVQAQMKALGLKTENQMQGWMISELGKHLASKGRRLIGWDEILEGDVPTSATVMSWRGEAGAVEAANKGHDVVMSPAPNLYLDNIQSAAGDEPPGRIGLQTLEMVYGYEPVRPGVTAEAAAHVLGAQGNAWSEYLATAKQKEHATFPACRRSPNLPGARATSATGRASSNACNRRCCAMNGRGSQRPMQPSP